MQTESGGSHGQRSGWLEKACRSTRERDQAKFEAAVQTEETSKKKQKKEEPRDAEMRSAPVAPAESPDTGGASSSASGQNVPVPGSSARPRDFETPEEDQREHKRVALPAEGSEQQQSEQAAQPAPLGRDDAGMQVEPPYSPRRGDSGQRSEKSSRIQDLSLLEVADRVQEGYGKLELECDRSDAMAIAALWTKLGKSSVDIAEAYSPPRCTALAGAFGLSPGFAIDLSTNKPDGSPWDLTKPGDVKLAEKLIDDTKPLFLIGTPPCEKRQPDSEVVKLPEEGCGGG